MDIVKLINITLSALIIIILLKRLNSDYALFASCILNVSITLFSFGILIPVFDYIKGLAAYGSASRLCEIMFKSAGICLICSVGAEICRDSGEVSAASKILLAGKCTLIAYALPLIQEVFSHATKFIS